MFKLDLPLKDTYLLQIKLVGKIPIAMNAKLGLPGFPLLALAAAYQAGLGRIWIFGKAYGEGSQPCC